MDFAERVTNLLRRHFQGARTEVDFAYGAERASGYIVWDGFDDMEPIDRQHMLFDVLRGELREDVQRVSIILTYTPDEYNIMASA